MNKTPLTNPDGQTGRPAVTAETAAAETATAKGAKSVRAEATPAEATPAEATPAEAATQQAVADSGGEIWEHVHPPASRRLLLAALEAMAERGYHGTTTREIAHRAGMSPAALYVHYPSKGELLYEISRVGHERLLKAVRAAASSGTDPVDAMVRFVRTYVMWHARFRRTSRLVQYELRSLPPERYRQIARLRHEFDDLVTGLVTDGVRSGDFEVENIGGTALAILSLGIDVARWYSPNDSPDPEALGDFYAELALRMLGHRG